MSTFTPNKGPVASAAPSFRWAEAQQAMPSFQAADTANASVDQIPVPSVLDNSPYMTTPGKGGGGTTPRPRALTPGGRSPATASSSTPRHRPLHEDLIERGKMYEHRKEAMREHALRKELSKCREVPKVSPMAQAIEREPGRIIKRLYAIAEEREKMAQFKEMGRNKEDQQRLDKWFKPAISSLGSRANTQTKAVRHAQWTQRKEERIAQHRRNQLLKELQHVREQPEINPRSEILAARAREREGLSTMSHLEGMMERERLSQLNRWENEQRQVAEEIPGTPRITAMAARMHAKTDIFDRLYHTTPSRYHNHSNTGELPNPDDLVNDVTRPFQQHTPVITAEAVKRFSVDGGLLERQEEYLRRKQERLRQAETQERRIHQPHIDPMSSRIANALPEDSETRLKNSALRSGSHRATSSHLSAANASSARATTPNPSLSRTSTNNNTSTPTTTNDLAVYERAVVAEMRRQQRLQRAREEHRTRQLQECTFQPETAGAGAAGNANTSSNDNNTQSSSSGSGSSTLDRMAQRSAEWAKKRDEKVQNMRSTGEQKAVEDCTFQPQTVHPSLKQYESNLYGGDGKPWGVNEFVARQNEARTRRDTHEQLQTASGTSSQGNRPTPAAQPTDYRRPLTEPQAPSFVSGGDSSSNANQQQNNTTSSSSSNQNQQQQQRSNIPSLDPPVKPPSHEFGTGGAGGVSAGARHSDPSSYNSSATSIAQNYLSSSAAVPSFLSSSSGGGGGSNYTPHHQAQRRTEL